MKTRYSAAATYQAAVAALVLAAVLLSLTAYQRFAVVGDSMAPSLLPGDRLLVRKVRGRAWKGRPAPRLRPGDIVVVPDPRAPGRALVKRVASVQGALVWLAGDNPGRSTDSRDFGPVPAENVLGKAVYRYGPPARAGRLPPATGPQPGSTQVRKSSSRRAAQSSAVMAKRTWSSQAPFISR